MLGQNHADLNFFIERVTLVIIIQSFCLLVVLFTYLGSEIRRRGKPWFRIFTCMPLGMSLALAMMLDEIGIFIIRIAVFVWRRSGNAEAGIPLNYAEQLALVVGAAIGGVGVLWLTLVLSRPLFGNWPWLVSAGLVAAYLAQSYALHYF